MKDLDFFTWRRDCSLRFQELTCAAEVYQELERQTQALEFDYYALCVRHPVPFTRPKISLQTTYPKLWMAQYQSAGNDSNLLIVFYVQIMPDDFVMQLHR
ncbi:autoinducer binding domain-containing protein, partial [Enterobacter roggenkampii]